MENKSTAHTHIDDQVRLFIGSIPKSISKKALQTALYKLTKGVRIYKFHIKRKKTESKSFAFFETKSPELAIELTSRPIKLKKKELYCQISRKSLTQLEPQLAMRGFVKNIPKDVPDRLVIQKLSDIAEVDSFYSIKDWNLTSKGYGFVDFKRTKDLKKVAEMGEIDIFGTKIEIEPYVAKEINGNKKPRKQQKRGKKDSQAVQETRRGEREEETKMNNIKPKQSLEVYYIKKNPKKINSKIHTSKVAQDQSKMDQEFGNIVPLLKSPHKEEPCPETEKVQSDEEWQRIKFWGKKKTVNLILAASSFLNTSESNYKLNQGRKARMKTKVVKRRGGSLKEFCQRFQTGDQVYNRGNSAFDLEIDRMLF